MDARKGDFYFSIVLLTLCVFVFVASFTFPEEAATFPRLSSAVLFVLAGFLMRSTFIGAKPKSDAAESKGFKYANATFLVSGLVVYALLLNFLGYIVMTMALVYYTIFVMGFRQRKWLILTTLLSVAVSYVVFNLLLGVPLPVSFVTRIIQG